MDPDSSSLLNQEAEKPPPPIGPEYLGSFFVGQNYPLPLFPHVFQKNLDRSQRTFYGKNDRLSLIKSIYLEIVNDLPQCKLLWEEFSPKKSLFDTWDFRYAFWKGYRHQPYFILLTNRKENLALLPLWYELEKQKYFWFGSWWNEDNTFFVKDPLFIPLLLAVAPKPLLLNAISYKQAEAVFSLVDLKPDDPKYMLDLKNLNSVDDFLSRMKKKKRYNLKRDHRIIESQNPKLVINNFSDLKSLIKLSKKRFLEKGEDTDWEDLRRVETFRQITISGRSGKSFKTRMITVIIGNQVAGVDLIATYKGCYYPLKCGYNVSGFPGIGNFVNLFEIEDALSLVMQKMDFLEIGYGWKEKWFEEVPLYKYEKKGKDQSLNTA